MDAGAWDELPIPVLPAKALVDTIAAKAMIPVIERIFFMLFESLLKLCGVLSVETKAIPELPGRILSHASGHMVPISVVPVISACMMVIVRH